MVFLALLAIAIGTVTALILMLVGLVEAPWPILLGLLLVGLYGLQRLSVQDQTLADSVVTLQEKAEQEQTEKTQGQTNEGLQYRGAHYKSEGVLNQTDSNQAAIVEGKYRGQHWQQPNPTSQEQTPSSSEIKYRGRKVVKPQSAPVSPKDASS